MCCVLLLWRVLRRVGLVLRTVWSIQIGWHGMILFSIFAKSILIIMKNTLVILALFLVSALGCKAQVAGHDIDVKHYEIHVNNLDFQTKALEATVLVTFEATASVDEIVLELKSLTVNSVTLLDVELSSFRQEGDFLIIDLPEALAAGNEYLMEVSYGGSTFNESWGGVHWDGEYVYNLGVGFDSQPHNLGKAWFPCVDDFTDKATYDVFVRADNAKKAICGGFLVDVVDQGDGTSIWHWQTSQELATYHISFTVGEYELWQDDYNGMAIDVYARPNKIDKVPGSFVHIKDIVAFYEDCLGPYPFSRVGYVGTPNGSMEHADNIFLANSLITGNTSGEGTIAHELSHMWFGNKVTCSTAQDMWLNEGFAQFLGNFYIAGVYGEKAYHEAMSPIVNNMSTKCRTQDFPTISEMPLDATYDGDAVYDRGAAVVSTMMKYMGREKFLQGLRAYMERYSYGAASSSDLMNTLTEATGIDMRGFFDTYVFHAGVPYYYVSIMDVNPVGSQFEVKLQMRYQHLNGEHVGEHNVYPVTFFDAEFNLYNDTVCWDGPLACTTKLLDFEPIGLVADFDNDYLEGATQKSGMLTQASSASQSNVQVEVTLLTDSVFYSITSHPVAPYDDPLVLGLTLSTSRFWTVNRFDFGPAEVRGVFIYRNSTTIDGDIIQTENDSATLVYRRNASEPWREIAHTLNPVNNWKQGQIFVDDLPSGDYAIAVWDKAHFGTEEQGFAPNKMQVFPNPVESQVNLKWNGFCNGSVVLLDAQGRVVRGFALVEANQLSFSIEGLAKGLYQVRRLDVDGDAVESNVLVIK